jgi:hypothetical protein
LSTGQIPAEFAIPKPDTNMAEASEETDKMETDGQDQEKNGADEQKQDEESIPTPIQEVVMFAVYFCLVSYATYCLHDSFLPRIFFAELYRIDVTPIHLYHRTIV